MVKLKIFRKPVWPHHNISQKDIHRSFTSVDNQFTKSEDGIFDLGHLNTHETQTNHAYFSHLTDKLAATDSWKQGKAPT